MSNRACFVSSQQIAEGDECALKVLIQAPASQLKGPDQLSLSSPFMTWRPFGGVLTGVWSGSSVELAPTLHNTMMLRLSLRYLAQGLSPASKVALPADFSPETAGVEALWKVWNAVQGPLLQGKVATHEDRALGVAMASRPAYDELVTVGSYGKNLWDEAAQMYSLARDEFTDCMVSGLSEEMAAIVSARVITKFLAETGVGGSKPCPLELDLAKDLVLQATAHPNPQDYPPDLIELGASLLRGHCFERGLEALALCARPSLIVSEANAQAGLRMFQVCAHVQHDVQAMRANEYENSKALKKVEVSIRTPSGVQSLLSALDTHGGIGKLEALTTSAKGINLLLRSDVSNPEFKIVMADAKASGAVLTWKVA